MSRPAVVFGDVHGDSAKLMRLIKMVRDRFGTEVDIYSVGDLIDRGHDSRGVIATCIEEGVQGILGNHELWFAQVLATGEMDDGVYAKIMGGLATIKSYALERGDPDVVGPALRARVPAKHRDYVHGLQPFLSIQVGEQKYLLLHTGISTDTLAGIDHALEGRPFSDEDKAALLLRIQPGVFFWLGTRTPALPEVVATLGDHVQVFGHTPIKEVASYPHYIALDTGCGTCPPYHLSAVILHDDGRREFLTIR